MIYQSEQITVKQLDNGIAELVFDNCNESINKFDSNTVASFTAALDVLESATDITGLLVSSGKPVFIVGADISEFVMLFDSDTQTIIQTLGINNTNFTRFSRLPFPTCVAINGYCLGGGMEFSLACDLRVMSTAARIGLPETNLGIIPGWGGTVRLPRLIGIEQALNWIASAADQPAEASLQVGAVEAIAEPEELRDVALETLNRAISGEIDYRQLREQRSGPIAVTESEAEILFAKIREAVLSKAGQHYPAPVVAVDSVSKSYKLHFDEALQVEALDFAELAQTDSAEALVGNFLSDQLLSRKAKQWEKQAQPVERAAVLGAGIMGGGIAYQSALKGTPIIMKDIAQQGLDLGVKEADKLLAKRVDRGAMTPEKKQQILDSIVPSLDYQDFDQVDIVVEAVIENPKIKHAVLAETEQQVRDDAVLVSNTSTISINWLAEVLQRPENFCGMHFFNPVHAMPLVEVIRGEKTADSTIARTVAYANRLGKKAVVVNDCPGFLVNRTLFPYFIGFHQLLRDGAEIAEVDRVMEDWGWPMGPALLIDVVGIDTCAHCLGVMAQGFPQRMAFAYQSATEILFENNRLGQKNGKGFYDFVTDERGKPSKQVSTEVRELLADTVAPARKFDADEIVMRMMLPMATEMARCLEENIVETAAEADMALLYGLGFPRFRGGILRWMDAVGLERLAEASARFGHLGESYQLTESMKAKLSSGQTYY